MFWEETPCTNSLCADTVTQTQQAIAAHPSVIIVWLGVNDFAAGRSAGDVTPDLDRMLGRLAATHARLFVVNNPTPIAFKASSKVIAAINEGDRDYNRLMLPTLARHHAALIDMNEYTHAIWGNIADIQQGDPPHPTVKGCVAIAQAVYAALQRNGVL
jgi:lysophospholipase L1-like esterase